MRCQHTSHEIPSFPVYSLGFIQDDRIVLGGGGGAGRSGIKNKLRLYDIKSSNKSIELVDELELERDEDAPMTLAVHPNKSEFVCGINSSVEKRKTGDNQNCRVYSISEKNTIVKNQTTSTLRIVDEEVDDYQKITAFDLSGDVVAVGCTNKQVSILSYPSLSPLCDVFSIPKEGGELFDVCFLDDHVIVCGSKSIYFVSIAKPKEGKKPPKKVAPIPVPTIVKDSTHVFRSARPSPSKQLYAIINTTPPRSSKGSARTSYVCIYDREGETWNMSGKPRSVSSKAVTVFDVNSKGTLLAYGSSDLSIGILDAKTLAPLVQILNAHEFPATALRFNTSSTLLVSGSADNTVRVVEVPAGLSNGAGGASGAMNVLMYVLIALLVVLLGVMMQSWGVLKMV